MMEITKSLDLNNQKKPISERYYISGIQLKWLLDINV